jgi:hypothetical protein
MAQCEQHDWQMNAPDDNMKRCFDCGRVEPMKLCAREQDHVFDCDTVNGITLCKCTKCDYGYGDADVDEWLAAGRKHHG